MEEKKKYEHQEEEENVNMLNEPAVGYTATPARPIDQSPNTSSIPGQYSAKEFDEYLDAFERDLLKGEECFYTAEEVVRMMGRW